MKVKVYRIVVVTEEEDFVLDEQTIASQILDNYVKDEDFTLAGCRLTDSIELGEQVSPSDIVAWTEEANNVLSTLIH
jgi:hypothetical protein